MSLDLQQWPGSEAVLETVQMFQNWWAHWWKAVSGLKLARQPPQWLCSANHAVKCSSEGQPQRPRQQTLQVGVSLTPQRQNSLIVHTRECSRARGRASHRVLRSSPKIKSQLIRGLINPIRVTAAILNVSQMFSVVATQSSGQSHSAKLRPSNHISGGFDFSPLGLVRCIPHMP